MNPLKRMLTPSISILLAAVLLSACQQDSWKATDKVEVISESISPDGKFIATVFTCSGGGAAGYTYTNVNLREVSESLNQRDFLLGDKLWNSFMDITTTWRNETNLEISYRWAGDHPDHRAMNGKKVSNQGDVTIRYHEKDTN